MSKQATQENEQLTDAMFYILLALLEERYGYVIMKYIEELSDGMMQMGPGTLYTVSYTHLDVYKRQYANSIQEQLLLAQTQGQSVYAVPILPKHISAQYRSDALFLGKDIESKEDCWLMLDSCSYLFICQAFQYANAFIAYLNEWKQRFPSYAQHLSLYQGTSSLPQQENQRIPVLLLSLIHIFRQYLQQRIK